MPGPQGPDFLTALTFCSRNYVDLNLAVTFPRCNLDNLFNLSNFFICKIRFLRDSLKKFYINAVLIKYLTLQEPQQKLAKFKNKKNRKDIYSCKCLVQ